jgi:hypothetical protein
MGGVGKTQIALRYANTSRSLDRRFREISEKLYLDTINLAENHKALITQVKDRLFRE